MQYDVPEPRILGALSSIASNTTLTMYRIGSPYIRIYVHNDSEYWRIGSSGNMTCNMTVSGIGGLHNSYAEAASTCYSVHAAWDSTTTVDDGDVGLFCVPSGTAITEAVIAALTGGDYDTWSPILAFMPNDASSNLFLLSERCSGRFVFVAPARGIQALSGGISTASWAVVDCSAFYPDEACEVRWVLEATQTAGALAQVEVGTEGEAEEIHFYFEHLHGGLIGYKIESHKQLDIEVTGNPAHGLIYGWDVAPTGGLDAYIHSVKLW